MLTNISYLWGKIKYRVKAYNKMTYDIDWGHTYEEEQLAKEKERIWNTKVNKYQLEAWAYFGLLTIELDKLFTEHIDTADERNFNLRRTYTVYETHNGVTRRRRKSKIKQMLKFMRHGFCHPEEHATLRLDPYISVRLNRSLENQDRSFHRVHFLPDASGEYYAQIGGGKLYFYEISKAIRYVNQILRD